jgi:hypothetical protein
VTRIAVLRHLYREIEPMPPRFLDVAAHIAWCERADTYFAEQLAMSVHEFHQWEQDRDVLSTSPDTA